MNKILKTQVYGKLMLQHLKLDNPESNNNFNIFILFVERIELFCFNVGYIARGGGR